MSRLRVLGPRDRLSPVLDALQDQGVLHPVASAHGGGEDAAGGLPREVARMRRARSEVERALEELGMKGGAAAVRGAPGSSGEDASDPARVAGWVRRARMVRRTLEAARGEAERLEEERALLARYRSFFASFEPLLAALDRIPEAAAFSVVLGPRQEGVVERLRNALEASLEGEAELWSRPLPDGDTALLILVKAPVARQVEALLAETRVEELEVPAVLRREGGLRNAEAVGAWLARVEEELARAREVPARLAAAEGPLLSAASAALLDHLAGLEAAGLVGFTPHAFVLEGWAPTDDLPRLRSALAAAVGPEVVVEEVEREEWEGEEAPVVLRNPRLIRPFERLVRVVPLPHYGTIDPTPFVAVFFPMFFGLILGDMGYGALLAVLALVLHHRSRPDTLLREVSEIAGAGALFTIVFGAAYGELFGDLGRRLGLRPLILDREEALLPFLGLAVALGAVHILLGLVLKVVAAARGPHPREAVGPGATVLMVLLVLGALLALFDVLPRGFFTPAVLIVLALFPVLVVAEGIVAPVEFLSTLGHILSYARVMALGTASVMMAVAANRMVGELGSVAVGALFALLFHLVNFALGLFSPTIHALRLHYVEFFGTFYGPGGTEYRPLTHWRPAPTPRP